MQLKLSFATAEKPRYRRSAPDVRKPGLPGKQTCKVPKAKAKLSISGSARMEEVAERLDEAFAKVAANKGTPGQSGASGYPKAVAESSVVSVSPT